MTYIQKLSFFLIVLVAFSCQNDVTKSFKNKPVALARMNEIVVLADDNLWESAIKDTFEFYFQSAYPILPAPEPMFDLRQFSQKKLAGEPLRKELRTYVVLADLNETESPTTKMLRKDLGEERYLKAKNDPNFNITIGKDKWARGQIVVYIFASGKKSLMNAIAANYSSIANRVRLHDKEKLDATIYSVKRENAGLMTRIGKRFGIDLRVPGDYKEVLPDNEELMYMRKSTTEALLNIVIKTEEYSSENQLSTDAIIAFRDEYGKKYIASEEEGSFMVTNTEDLPTYTYQYDLDEMYTVEVRGIWEMENDFKGGPYVTYAILNKNRNEVIYIDVFVLAIGQDKRDLMMQLDHIVKTSKMAAESE